jgi:hypothetical protein
MALMSNLAFKFFCFRNLRFWKLEGRLGFIARAFDEADRAEVVALRGRLECERWKGGLIILKLASQEYVWHYLKPN